MAAVLIANRPFYLWNQHYYQYLDITLGRLWLVLNIITIPMTLALEAILLLTRYDSLLWLRNTLLAALSSTTLNRVMEWFYILGFIVDGIIGMFYLVVISCGSHYNIMRRFIGSYL